jgi:hypothetical protein
MFRRVLLAAALSAVFVSAASAATISYSARLSGRSEIPKTDSKGTGKLAATFDTQSKALNYTLTFDGLSGPATAATSPITGTITMTDEQVKMLQSAKLYVNVHTAANPGGEIRGQITGLHAKKTTKAAPAAAPAAATPAPAAPAPAAPAPAAPK